MAATQETPPGDTPEGDDSYPRRARADAPLVAGDVLGRYILLHKIGAGGMGIVFAAYDPQLDRRVALKLLHPKRAGKDSSEGQGALLREAQAMARIEHSNIVTVHDVGTIEGRPDVFVAMEFVEGLTVRRWRSETRPGWREVVDVFARAGRGLAAVHAAELVHLDFKPDNVMVAFSGKGPARRVARVLVMDFGLARGQRSLPFAISDEASLASAESYSRLDSVVGTPPYMAPEQYLGVAVDAKTDQFSFCVTLFEALYGRRPFAGRSAAELSMEITEGNVREPPDETDVPPWVHEVVIRGLQPDPDQRWPSMEDLVRELMRDPTVKRRRWVMVGVGVGAITLAAGGVLYADARASQLCRGAADKLADVWDGQRKERVQASFLSTGVPYAEHAWGEVERRLDDYTRDWVELHREACEATNVRGEQSAEVLDLRVDCLSDRLDGVGALAEVYATADAKVVEHAVRALGTLQRLERCSDPEALAQAVQPPDDPEVRRAVEAYRRTLAEARALRSAGRYREAAELATGVVRGSADLGFAPLRARALYEEGYALEQAGDLEGGKASLSEAFWVASAKGIDDLAAGASVELVAVVGYRLARYEEGVVWARHADAALDRAGELPALQAALLNNVGLALHGNGDYDGARRYHERALDQRTRVLGVRDLAVANSLNNIGIALHELGEMPRAREYHQRALALRTERLGETHPSVASSLNNLANVAFNQQEHAEAARGYRLAAQTHERALGPLHPNLAASLGNVGSALLIQGQRQAAIPFLRRSVRIRERTLGPRHPDVADAVANLSVAYRDTEEFVVPLRRRALAIQLHQTGEGHPNVAAARSLLAIALARHGHFQEALPLAIQSLATRETLYGPHDQRVADNVADIASMVAEHDPRMANAYSDRALASSERSLPPDDPRLGVALRRAADLAVDVGEAERALVLAERAAPLLVGEPLALARLDFAFARALWELKRDRNQAIALAKQAQTTLESTLGGNRAVTEWLRERGH